MPHFRLVVLAVLAASACAEDPMAQRKSQMDAYESRFGAAEDAVSGARRDCPSYMSAHSDIVAADRQGQEAAVKSYREGESATILSYVNQRSSDLLMKLADKAVQNRCFREADYLYDAVLRTTADPVVRERARQRKAEAIVLRESGPARR